MDIEIQGPEGKQITIPLINAVSNLRPILSVIGETLVNSVLKNFDEGGRPEKWEESKRAQREGGQTLVDTAVMRNSTNWQITGDAEVSVGLSDEKAVWHDSPSDDSVNPERKILLIQEEDYELIKDIVNQYIIGKLQ